MDRAAAIQWCEEGARSVSSMVIDLPGEAWAVEQITQAVKTLSPDRKVWVIAVKTDSGTSRTYALLEWKQGIPESFKGTSIQLANKTELGIIHLKVPDVGPTSSRQAESTTEEVLPPSPLATIGPEIFTARGEFVSKLQKGNPVCSGAGYRKLRIFSGEQPVPTGEEEYEVWMEQAMQALEEWDLPEAQKKQCISESLQGAAAEAMRNLKFSNTTCTAYDYLAMLQEEFGGTEKAADLIYQFKHALQRQGERLSEYTRRLNKMLYQIVIKKRDDAFCHRPGQNTANLKGGPTLRPSLASAEDLCGCFVPKIP
ncbi:paraneoplastic antigen Ma1 homolog [Aquarana catesbeiana]|uniref:paraneoplastic antigen Ma1 homolog n=1 Tax=Aquarana catesbeiana TaxID=8400 RepID=UPI003CC99545